MTVYLLVSASSSLLFVACALLAKRRRIPTAPGDGPEFPTGAVHRVQSLGSVPTSRLLLH